MWPRRGVGRVWEERRYGLLGGGRLIVCVDVRICIEMTVCVCVCVCVCLCLYLTAYLYILYICVSASVVLFNPLTHSGSRASCLCEEEEVLDWFHDLNAMKYCKQFVEKVPRCDYMCVRAHMHTHNTHTVPSGYKHNNTFTQPV